MSSLQDLPPELAARAQREIEAIERFHGRVRSAMGLAVVLLAVAIWLWR